MGWSKWGGRNVAGEVLWGGNEGGAGSTDMRRSLDKLLDLRISLSSQREVSGREDVGGGSGEFMVKSDLESDERRQVAARAMQKKEGRAGRADGGGNCDERGRGEKT